jgi:flavin reductase
MVSRQLFRDGMARFAAAVHIVTTGGPAGSTGFTASSACSVTANPPTLLVCLNRASQLHPIFQENGVFCLNTLSAEHKQLAKIFSEQGGMPMRDRFRLPVWTKNKTRLPVLRDALVSFECRIIDVQEVGTHWVMFGLVKKIRMASHASALLYLHRSYRELSLPHPTDE